MGAESAKNLWGLKCFIEVHPAGQFQKGVFA